MKRSFTVKEARKLLPDETRNLIDAQVNFMISRIGEVDETKFKEAWEYQLNQHLRELASFLYDMYRKDKLREPEL